MEMECWYANPETIRAVHVAIIMVVEKTTRDR